MEIFEATESQENTGAGSRQEGRQFELLARRWWQAVVDHVAAADGISATRFNAADGKTWVRLQRGTRAAVIRSTSQDAALAVRQQRWLERTFRVDELVAQFPGMAVAVDRYAPDTGLFGGAAYPEMFKGLTTDFDDTIVLEDAGVLKNKILLEYKTAKRVKTSPTKLEGNAHERLSFQMMQYLEIATRYTRCTFWVMVNGAFSRLRNKYHVNFHIQSERLRNFAWFEMTHASTAAEYLSLYSQIENFLLEGGQA
jgi:hypothetical protein